MYACVFVFGSASLLPRLLPGTTSAFFSTLIKLVLSMAAVSEPSQPARAAQQLSCRTCQMIATQLVKGRCAECNSCSARVDRIMAAHGEWSMPQNIKDDTIRDARKLYGEDLIGIISCRVTTVQVQGHEVEFVGTGNFMDLEDLEMKYKNKPERLAAIKKNTKTIFDTVSECTLYEDKMYQSKNINLASTKRTVENDMQINSKRIKGPKKIKGAKVAVEMVEVEQKPLTEKAIATLKKSKEGISTAREKLRKTVEPLNNFVVNPWIENVLDYVGNKVKVVVAMKDTVVSALDLAIDAKSGGVKQLQMQVAECKGEIREVNRMATLQIQEAQRV